MQSERTVWDKELVVALDEHNQCSRRQVHVLQRVCFFQHAARDGHVAQVRVDLLRQFDAKFVIRFLKLSRLAGQDAHKQEHGADHEDVF